MAVNATWIQAGGDTAAQDRALQTALLTKGALVTARPGVLPSTLGDLAVTAQGSPNMTVNVAAGQCVIEDSTGLAYVLTNDATVVVTISTASGSNPRFDLIIARIYDNAAGDSVSTTTLAMAGATAGNATVQTKTAAIEVVTGTPAGSPVAPALPNSRCVILAVITVGTSVTSINSGNIAASGGGAVATGYTAAAGGVVICRTSAEYPASPYEGMTIYDLALNSLVFWNASSWQLVNYDTGWVTPTLGNSWVSFDGGSTFAIPQYRSKAGVVYLQGLMKLGVGTGVAWTLPAGFRPLKELIFTQQSNTGIAFVYVASSGNVFVNSYGSGGSNAFVSLNGITFIAEQ